MYSGSAAFQTANQAAIQKHKLRGYIGLIAFDDSNILSGSISLERKNADESDIQIGAVFIGSLSMTFLKNTPITPRGWVGKTLTLEFGLEVSEDTYEWMPMGVFSIADATIDASGTTITAYDAMSKFDENLPDWYTTSGSVYSVVQSICSRFSVPFRMTEAQVQALPNGTQPIGLYKPNDCQTYRDIIFWVSQVIGGWAEIDRDGYFVLKTYPRNGVSDVTLTSSDLVSGAQFSSWVTDFGAVTFENEDQTTSLYGSSGVGLTYQAGMNPFLIYGTGGTQTQMRTEVLNTLTHIKYQPFNVSMMCAPVFDLGDVIYFSGDIAGSESAMGIVNSISYGYKNGFTICGVGANPNLQSTMDESEKAAAESRRSASDKEIEYYSYTNGNEITIGSEPVKVCDILFSSDKATTVEMWHEFQIETSPSDASMELEAIYYMDLVELDRKPVETYSDAAKHLLDLHYMSRVYDEGSHTWQVYLVATGGTATMRADGGISVLKGQGLAKQDKWNGVIVLDDTVSAFTIISLLGTLSELVYCKSEALTYDEVFSENVSGYSSVLVTEGLTETVTFVFGYADWINFCGENYYCGTEGVLL